MNDAITVIYAQLLRREKQSFRNLKSWEIDRNHHWTKWDTHENSSPRS